MNNREYALYKGDQFIMIGTLQNIADELNVTRRGLYYYLSPFYAKKLANMKSTSKAIVIVDAEDDYDLEVGE